MSMGRQNRIVPVHTDVAGLSEQAVKGAKIRIVLASRFENWQVRSLNNDDQVVQLILLRLCQWRQIGRS